MYATIWYCNNQHFFTIQWRHSGCDGFSNHRRLDCLFNHLLRRRTNKTSKLWVIYLCEEKPHQWPMDSLHKGPVTPKMFPFDDVIVEFSTIGSMLIFKVELEFSSFFIFPQDRTKRALKWHMFLIVQRHGQSGHHMVWSRSNFSGYHGVRTRTAQIYEGHNVPMQIWQQLVSSHVLWTRILWDLASFPSRIR